VVGRRGALNLGILAKRNTCKNGRQINRLQALSIFSRLPPSRECVGGSRSVILNGAILSLQSFVEFSPADFPSADFSDYNISPDI
jgi:hypothetical protein